VKEKHQSPAQRLANPVWLRDQINKLVRHCDENIEEDQKLASQTGDDDYRKICLERVEIARHLKRQLERILRGKTLTEELTAKWQEIIP
jgi:hypothetical protein